jgi:hypothetical protein
MDFEYIYALQSPRLKEIMTEYRHIAQVYKNAKRAYQTVGEVTLSSPSSTGGISMLKMSSGTNLRGVKFSNG